VARICALQERSEYAKKLVQAVMAAPAVAAGGDVCLMGYGIGNFGCSVVSRLQFCCMRALAEALPLSSPPEVTRTPACAIRSPLCLILVVLGKLAPAFDTHATHHQRRLAWDITAIP
jgi:hypothetical protein